MRVSMEVEKINSQMTDCEQCDCNLTKLQSEFHECHPATANCPATNQHKSDHRLIKQIWTINPGYPSTGHDHALLNRRLKCLNVLFFWLPCVNCLAVLLHAPLNFWRYELGLQSDDQCNRPQIHTRTLHLATLSPVHSFSSHQVSECKPHSIAKKPRTWAF